MYNVIENFIDEETLECVWREIDLLSPNMTTPENTGAANGKSGKGVMFTGSVCEQIFPAITSLKDQAGVTENNFTLLVNNYGDGDYYAPHKDSSLHTLNIVLSREENSFTGGDFKFNDLDIEIPFRNNTAILFESNMTHEVTPVKLDPSISTGRYSLTFFLY